MESPLLKELEAAGCAIAQNLEATYMGNEAFYVRILQKLSKSTCLPRMQSALADGDVAAFFAAAHELKGLYATLGLTPLFELSAEIVEIARAGSLDGVPEALAGLLQRHCAIETIIAAHAEG